MNQTRGNTSASAWTLLALWVALAAMGLVVYLLFELQQYRATTAELLKTVSSKISGLSQNDMEYTFKIDQTIPFAVSVPINQELAIPVKFELNDTFPLQAVIPLNTKINLPITTNIPVNQKFNVSLNLLGQDIVLPVAIQGTLPVDVNLDVPFKQDVQINARVPIKVPIDTTIKINLSQNIPIQSQVPVKMDVPIKVSIKDLVGVADLSTQLDGMANDLTAGPSPLVIAGILLAFLLVSVVLLVIFLATRQPPAPTYSENLIPPEEYNNDRP